MSEIGKFAGEHRVTPADLADEGLKLGVRKIEGLAE